MDDANIEPAYDCPKCHHPRYMLQELRGSSGGFFAALDIDDHRLSLVICQRCRYVEMFMLTKEQFRARYGTASEV